MKHLLSPRVLLFIFVVFGSVQLLCAQDTDEVEQGIKAYGAYRGGEIDDISMTSGSLTIGAPLVSWPQRGRLHLGYELVYARPTFKQSTRCLGGDCTVHVVRTNPLFLGIQPISDRGYTTSSTTIIETGTQVGFGYTSLVSPDGASHIMAQISSSLSESVDGTSFFRNPTTFVVYDADGIKYGTTSMLEDPNGNQLVQVSGGIRDSVGRTIPAPPTFAGANGLGTCPTGALPVNKKGTWGVPGPNSGTSTFVFCWAQVSVIFDWDITDGTYSTTNENRLQSVVLPNGTAWMFQYSTDGYGDLTQITFPTGGILSYTWSEGTSCSGLEIGPRVLASRTINANDGTGNHTWTYTIHQPNGFINSTGTTTVADPLGNNIVYTNTSLSYCSSFNTSVQYYQGSVQLSNLLKTVTTVYSTTAGPYAPSLGQNFINIVPTQITTTWPNGKTSQVTKTYDTGFTFTSPRYNDSTQYQGLYGKVTTENDYDYGNNAPGPLLKQTKTSYAWQSGNPNYASYLSNNMLNLVYSTQITDGTSQMALTQYGHDESAPVSSLMGPSQNLDTAPWTGSYRGNVTSVNRWRNLPTVKTLTTTNTNYDTGMLSTSKDPLLNQTTYLYSGTFQGAYLTEVTNAAGESTYYNYDYNTGLLNSTTDPNGQPTTNTYDSNWRITGVTRPTGGGQTSFCYTDLNSSNCSSGTSTFQVVITNSITGAVSKIESASVDGVGRLAHTELYDPERNDFVDITYDGEGNKKTVSNPYGSTSDSTYGITTYTYDGLRRMMQVTQPDNSPLKTVHCDNTSLVTDEAGHWRRSTVDGLGRLVEVDEPNSPTATVNSNGCPGTSDPIWVTTYGYDQLGNLTSVSQVGSRPRTFAYDSLSRLLTATNPESGTLTYTYDDDGNVSTKVSPLQNQTNSSNKVTLNYCYDSVNRLTAKWYTPQTSCASPTVSYTYGLPSGSSCTGSPSSPCNVGRRIAMTDQAGSESWSYDAMGRVQSQSRTTNSVTKTTSYTYNLDSSIATMTYPSGRVVTYTPNSAGRPSQLKDNTTGVYYATGTCPSGISYNGACHAPFGAFSLVQNGSSLFATHIYNDRLQPCWMYATTSTALATSRGCNDTATAGNMLDLKYNFSLGSDNGNPISITNNRVTDRSQTFAYDQLNRISAAYTTATHSSNPNDCWGQAFGFDTTGNWGNLLSISGYSSAYTGCTQGSLTVSVTANNQISSDTYDAAGNLWVIPGTGGATYTNNAENQLVSTSNSPIQYVYDGDGNRVEKTGSKLYWYAGGEILDETDTTGSTTNSSFNEYYFFGGNRIARRDSSSNVFYYLVDHLGTSRVLAEVPSGQTTASLCYDADFEPYGGEHAYTNNCPQNYKFTSKERDTESGLDNFGARYNASSLGRFMSPDPIAGQAANPQSLNLYSYVRNNPLVFTDPTGMIVEWHDSKVKCKSGEVECRTDAQRAYEDRLKQLRESKNAKDRAKGEKLSDAYQRLQQSKAVFEVTNDRRSGSNGGEITYQGKDHFTINLHGNDNYGLTENQRLAHEFEHGRQVLDRELSFINTPTGWKPFVHDRTDEAEGFSSGFDIERATPGQGAFINSMQQQLDLGGISAGAQFLGSGNSTYRNLPEGPINVEISSPSIYKVPE